MSYWLFTACFGVFWPHWAMGWPPKAKNLKISESLVLLENQQEKKFGQVLSQKKYIFDILKKQVVRNEALYWELWCWSARIGIIHFSRFTHILMSLQRALTMRNDLLSYGFQIQMRKKGKNFSFSEWKKENRCTNKKENTLLKIFLLCLQKKFFQN